MLSQDLQNLERAVDGADADPGPDVVTSFAKLSRLLASTLDEWQHLKLGELSSLNAKITATGAKPIPL
jgi:hypothetical protein